MALQARFTQYLQAAATVLFAQTAAAVLSQFSTVAVVFASVQHQQLACLCGDTCLKPYGSVLKAHANNFMCAAHISPWSIYCISCTVL
jgi:hypothetical protein